MFLRLTPFFDCSVLVKDGASHFNVLLCLIYSYERKIVYVLPLLQRAWSRRLKDQASRGAKSGYRSH